MLLLPFDSEPRGKRKEFDKDRLARSLNSKSEVMCKQIKLVADKMILIVLFAF